MYGAAIGWTDYYKCMVLVLENAEDSMPVVLHPPAMSDDEYFDFCQQFGNYRVERMADRSVIIMPPAGFESGYRNSGLSA